MILTMLLFNSWFLLSAAASDRLVFKVESGGAEDEKSKLGPEIDAMEIKDYQDPGPNCRHDPHPKHCHSPPSTNNFGKAEMPTPAAMTTNIATNIYRVRNYIFGSTVWA
ncbi:hypothetical protein POM88_041430 [Heracleum sosnowskyi]|uniref:Uncharacterized protein n=1 Tax=Heracleum sosnowskyi TaxID=360622 RepID=A0AAD8MAR7_9APIA|nr:hypothetical protein POM88_041430 [Heracleum sosnowskyi]